MGAFLNKWIRQEARDSILAATPVPVAGTGLVLRPWTRIVHAKAVSMQYKVAL